MKHFTLIRLAKFFLCIILLSPVLQSQLASSTPKNPNDTVGVGTTAPKPKPKPKPQGQGKSGKSDGAKKAMDMMKKLQQLAGQGQKSQKAQDQAKLKSAASDSLKGKDSNELGKHYTLVENQFKAKYLMLSQKKMAIFKKFEAGLKEQLKEQKDATKKLEDLTKKIKKAQKELKNTGKSAKESSDELQQALQFQSTSMGCDNSSKKCKFWDMYKPYKKQLLNKINKAQRAITKVHKPIQLSNDSVDKSYKHHKEKINKKIKDFARKMHMASYKARSDAKAAAKAGYFAASTISGSLADRGLQGPEEGNTKEYGRAASGAFDLCCQVDKKNHSDVYAISFYLNVIASANFMEYRHYDHNFDAQMNEIIQQLKDPVVAKELNATRHAQLVSSVNLLQGIMSGQAHLESKMYYLAAQGFVKMFVEQEIKAKDIREKNAKEADTAMKNWIKTSKAADQAAQTVLAAKKRLLEFAKLTDGEADSWKGRGCPVMPKKKDPENNSKGVCKAAQAQKKKTTAEVKERNKPIAEAEGNKKKTEADKKYADKGKKRCEKESKKHAPAHAQLTCKKTMPQKETGFKCKSTHPKQNEAFKEKFKRGKKAIYKQVEYNPGKNYFLKLAMLLIDSAQATPPPSASPRKKNEGIFGNVSGSLGLSPGTQAHNVFSQEWIKTSTASKEEFQKPDKRLRFIEHNLAESKASYYEMKQAVDEAQKNLQKGFELARQMDGKTRGDAGQAGGSPLKGAQNAMQNAQKMMQMLQQMMGKGGGGGGSGGGGSGDAGGGGVADSGLGGGFGSPDMSDLGGLKNDLGDLGTEKFDTGNLGDLGGSFSGDSGIEDYSAPDSPDLGDVEALGGLGGGGGQGDGYNEYLGGGDGGQVGGEGSFGDYGGGSSPSAGLGGDQFESGGAGGGGTSSSGTAASGGGGSIDSSTPLGQSASSSSTYRPGTALGGASLGVDGAIVGKKNLDDSDTSVRLGAGALGKGQGSTVISTGFDGLRGAGEKLGSTGSTTGGSNASRSGAVRSQRGTKANVGPHIKGMGRSKGSKGFSAIEQEIAQKRKELDKTDYDKVKYNFGKLDVGGKNNKGLFSASSSGLYNSPSGGSGGGSGGVMSGVDIADKDGYTPGKYTNGFEEDDDDDDDDEGFGEGYGDDSGDGRQSQLDDDDEDYDEDDDDSYSYDDEEQSRQHQQYAKMHPDDYVGVVTDPSVSIFKVLTKRYKENAYPVIFESYE
ncbi:MAG: hypothetical protein ISR65_14830 [Bacteriovoracaceae bacterium]|nr:hypothetical protein [Bacteriovoracaceae bacterium]